MAEHAIAAKDGVVRHATYFARAQALVSAVDRGNVWVVACAPVMQTIMVHYATAPTASTASQRIVVSCAIEHQVHASASLSAQEPTAPHVFLGTMAQHATLSVTARTMGRVMQYKVCATAIKAR